METTTLLVAAIAIPPMVAAVLHLRAQRRLEWLQRRMGTG